MFYRTPRPRLYKRKHLYVRVNKYVRVIHLIPENEKVNALLCFSSLRVFVGSILKTNKPSIT